MLATVMLATVARFPPLGQYVALLPADAVRAMDDANG